MTIVHHKNLVKQINDRKKVLSAKRKKSKGPIGIGTHIAERPSHTTGRTDRVCGDSGDQAD